MRTTNDLKSRRHMGVTATRGRLLLASATLLTMVAASAQAVVVFEDDFESCTLNNWQCACGAPCALDGTKNAVPTVGGSYSICDSCTSSRIYHCLGFELNGRSSFSVWIYDAGMTRSIAQVHAYSGPFNTQNEGLEQCLGIGKYNGVTMPGEFYDARYYQGRVAFPTATKGWFNLNARGAKQRSVGWHKFTIERLADNTTLNFYVDGVLGRTITGATPATWDSITLGLGGGTEVANTWYDGVQVTVTGPGDIVVNNDAGVCGAAVNYTCPGGMQTAGLPSGAVFPAGETVNTFAFGDTAICSFSVTVVDNEPPTLSVADMTVPATCPAGAVVTLEAVAADNCSIELAFEPASGCLFPIGQTTVSCVAADPAGNLDADTFTVRVKGAEEQLSDLVALLQSMSLPRTKEHCLMVKLAAAQAAYNRGIIPPVCENLILFTEEVAAQAQSGKGVTRPQAELLTQEALRIRAVLNCPPH